MGGAGGGPEAECAVDVDPGVVAVGYGNEGGEVVEGSEVEIAGLENDDGRSVRCGEGLLKYFGSQAAVFAGGKGDDAAFADAEKACSARKGTMALDAGEDADGG